MVDRLRSAAEQLEAPTCPDCRIEMRWYRSELLADEHRASLRLPALQSRRADGPQGFPSAAFVAYAA